MEVVVVESVTLDGAGGIRHLPGGIEQYLQQTRAATERATVAARPAAAGARDGARRPSGAVVREARKELGRLERALDRLGDREARLHEEMAAQATDHVRLGELDTELSALATERDELEAAWLETAAVLED